MTAPLPQFVEGARVAQLVEQARREERALALEEAAQACEKFGKHCPRFSPERFTAFACVAAVRVLAADAIRARGSAA